MTATAFATARRARVRTASGRLALAVALGVSAQACATEGLAFKQDSRVTITVPSDSGAARLPLDVEWEATGYDGRFAVFFDQSPIRPGQTMLSLVADDDPCHRSRDCLDPKRLADRNIYVTDGTSVVVDTLPDRRSNKRDEDRHDLTIVYLDEHGERRGEAAFTREFIVDREG